VVGGLCRVQGISEQMGLGSLAEAHRPAEVVEWSARAGAGGLTNVWT